MVTFSKMKTHYKTEYQLDTKLFTKDSRTEPVKKLYEEARDKHQLQVRKVDVMQTHGESLSSLRRMMRNVVCSCWRPLTPY